MAIPVITQQPISILCSLGSNVSFTVIADGDSLSYQWLKIAEPVGTDSSVLEINNVVESDFSSYSVVVSNADGSVQSNIVSLSKEITDVDVPEKTIPSYVDRPPIRVQLNGPMGLYPDAVLLENALIRAKIDLGDGSYVDVPDTYRITQPPQPGKNIVIYMVIKITEE
jgi:hypothetical protein